MTKFKYHKDGTQAQRDEIFVFGSNKIGAHGGGAARAAYDDYGATWGVGYGLQGRSYAIPTKDHNIRSMTLDEVYDYVVGFAFYTRNNPTMQFFVTAVGCGLAGNAPKDIAPMFKDCHTNCSFPEEWKEFLE